MILGVAEQTLLLFHRNRFSFDLDSCTDPIFAVMTSSPEIRRAVATPQDEALKAAVVSSWQASGYGPLSRLECSVVEGVVNLRGVVPNFFLKQMAQALVMRIKHVKHIRNHVSVG